MGVTHLAVRRPLVVLMFFLAVALMGLLAYTKLPADLFPKANLPYISVVTVYPGASPEDVETFVTKPIEDALAGVSGLKHIDSTSAEGVSYVNMEFEISTSADAAATDTERALATIKSDLPVDAKAPVVTKNGISGAVMNVALQGTLPADQLFALADQKVRARFETVPGVGQVRLIGGHERELQVRFDPQKLQAYSVSVDQVRVALATENVNIPGGALDQAGKEYNARLLGLYQNPADLLGLAVAAGPTGTVHLRDVAMVEDTTKKADLIYRVDGQNAIAFAVDKASDANSIAVTKGVKKEIDALQPTMPPGVKLSVSYDSSTFIEQSLHGVQENLVEAVFLAGLVLLLFLHTWRSTFIVLLAIPSSLVATYGVMFIAGFSLNQLSLLALALSIGVLVDDSIVVLENIFRHLESGREPRVAAIEGRSEIGSAALAITLVDVVVYTPLGLLSGLVGQFFREFGLSVVAAVLFSLLVSFTLTPMLASRWLKTRDALEKKRGLARFGAWWDRGFTRLERIYERLLGWALDHRWVVGLVSVASVAVAVSYFLLHLVGTEFIPTADQGVLTVEAHMPPGTELTTTDRAARELEAKLGAIPEVDHVLTSVGTANDTGFQQQTAPRFLEMTVLLKDRGQRHRTVDETAPDVDAAMRTIPGLTGRTELPSTSGTVPLVLQLRGEDGAKVIQYGDQIEQAVKHIKGTRDVTNSNQVGLPELDVVVDHAKVADLGLTSAQVAGVLRTGLTGDVVTQLRPKGQKQVDIRLISKGGSATTVRDLASLPILSSNGSTILMGQVGRIETVDSVPQIDRRDRERTVSIGASLDGSRSLGDVTTDAQAAIKHMDLPADYTVELAGDAQLQGDSFNSFGIALGLGFILMYMLMAALFESFLYPLAVMFSVPVAIFGACTALVLFRENLGLYSMLGLIMLMGLVAKNAILVIDFTERMRAQGMPRRDALLHAGPIRLRPILMTTCTLVVSMIPLAFNLTVGSETRASIGAVVIGGMLSSTLLSLVLVPVVYSTLDDMKQGFAGLRDRFARRQLKGDAVPSDGRVAPESVMALADFGDS